MRAYTTFLFHAPEQTTPQRGRARDGGLLCHQAGRVFLVRLVRLVRVVRQPRTLNWPSCWSWFLVG